MKQILKLVFLLVLGQTALAQAPSNYTNINGRYRWIAGMFDSTFHIPKGTTPSLRTGGSTNAGGLFYNTGDSSVYTYTGTQWIKVRGSLNPSDTTNKYVTQVYKKNGSDSVFYVKGGVHTWAFNDSTGAPGGGGGGKIYYFNGGVSMGTFGGFTMYELGDTANTGAAANFTRATTGNIANFITDPNKPGLLQIPAGVWSVDAWLSETGGGANHAEIYVKVEKWNGTSISTIATSPIEEITEGSTPNLYTWSVTIPTTTLAVTDRIILQFYIQNTNGKTVTLYTQNGYVGEVHTTFTTGIGAINGLTAPAQYLVTGTSGTDFNINSTTATHTFNLPTASATNRGALSSTDWTTFNNKGSVSSVATNNGTGITGGTITTTGTLAIDTLLISTRAWRQKGIDSLQANINTKQNTLTLTTTGTSGAATLVGATLNIPQYQSALTNPVTGTGVNNQAAFFTGTNTIAGSSVLVLDGSNIAIGQAAAAQKLSVNGDVSIATINNATIDTDKFLVSDGGVVKYRTGSEVLSDIGAAASTSVSGTTNYIPKFTSSSAIGNSQIFDNGTNVGIGTTSPAAKLDVTGIMRVTTNITWGTAANGTTGQIATDNTNNYLDYLGALIFRTAAASSEKMRLDASGNLGLGTSSPAYKLDVNTVGGSAATARLYGNDQANVRLRLENTGGRTWELVGGLPGANNSNFSIYDVTGTATRLTIDASGNVGIGTSSPKLNGNGGTFLTIDGGSSFSGWLELATSSTTDGIGGVISFNNNNIVGTDKRNAQISGVREGANNSGALAFATFNAGTGAERMRITSGGNLLVGTTTDIGDKMYVNGSIRIPSTFFFRYDGDVGLIGSATSIGGTASQLGIRAANDILFATNGANERMRITSGGNVGIGLTSIVAKLQVENSASADPTSLSSVPTTNIFGMSTSPGGMLAAGIGTTGGTHVWLQGRNVGGAGVSYPISLQPLGGNVGIGTSSPMTFGGFTNLTIRSSSSTNQAAIFLLNSTETIRSSWYSNGATQVNFGTATNHPLVFDVNDIERMRISSGGLVGIGTTSPYSLLQVTSGTAMTTTGGDQASNATIEGANVAIGASFTSQLAVLSNSTIAADIGGGIVFGSKYSGNAFAYYAAIKTGKDDATSGNYGGYLQFATRTNGGNVTERMRITSAGELLINTTTDAGNYKLQVSGDVYATAYFESSDLRLKNVLSERQGSDGINTINFKWKDGRDNLTHIGYAAQQVEKVLPDAVKTNPDGYKTVNYDEVQTLKIANLEQEVKELKALINKLMDKK